MDRRSHWQPLGAQVVLERPPAQQPKHKGRELSESQEGGKCGADSELPCLLVAMQQRQLRHQLIDAVPVRPCVAAA